MLGAEVCVICARALPEANRPDGPGQHLHDAILSMNESLSMAGQLMGKHVHRQLLPTPKLDRPAMTLPINDSLSLLAAQAYCALAHIA
jgi:hypothetical protein